MFGQQTPRRWGWGTPLKKRTAARTPENYVMPDRLVNRKERSFLRRAHGGGESGVLREGAEAPGKGREGRMVSGELMAGE